MYTIEWTSAGVLQRHVVDSKQKARACKKHFESYGYVVRIIFNGLYIEL